MAAADDVAAAILAEVGPVDTMKLQKLTYYCQAWSLAVFDRPLVAGRFEAWKDGPVSPTLWRHHSGRRYVDEWPHGDRHRLAKDEADLVHLVCAHYGAMSGNDLSDLTHQEQPWVEARRDTPAGEASRETIERPSITSFYRSRQLVGRYAGDLAVGGLWLMPPPSDRLDRDELRRQLEAIRDEYRTPDHDGEDEPWNSGQFTSAPRSPEVARRRGGGKPSRRERAE